MIAAAFLAVSCKKQRAAVAANDNIAYYTCTMHPSVHSATPGKCPICGMDLVPVYKASAAAKSSPKNTNQDIAREQSGRRIEYYQSTMNPKETSPVPAKDSMGMEMEPVYAKPAGVGNQPAEFIVPIERQQQFGVTYATAEKRPAIFSIRAVGVVADDARRHWDYVSRVEGYVAKLYVASAGVVVEKNAPLLTVYSPDFLTTEREFIDLLHTRNRATNNAALAESTGQLVQSARERFRLWNLTDEQIDALARTGKASENVTLMAPFGGVVESLEAVQGAKVMPGDKLAGVTDLSVVWVWAQFYQDEIPLLKAGLPVIVTIPSVPGRKFDGTISVVDPFVNDASHAARVRIDVKNPGLKLWPGMYVNAQLNIDEGECLTVPVNAVLPTGPRNIVFVDKGGGKLEPRFIQLGMQFGSFYEVKSGLTNGERVVDSANFLIDAESQIQGALKSWSPEE